MELIVTNQNDFNLLKEYASYYSERTKVIEIESSSIEYVLENYKHILDKYTDTNINIEISKPELIISSGRLYLSNADESLSVYLNLPYSKEVKLDAYEKVIELLWNGVIKASPEVSLLFTQLSENDPISSLFCSKFAINYKHHRWTLNSLGDQVTIKDLKFDERTIEDKTYKVYRNIIIDSISGNNVLGHTLYGQVELRFYFLTFDQKNLFKPGNTVNAMVEKAYGGKSKKILMSPEIVPSSFPKNYTRRELKTTKRDIPVKLLRAAYMEYSYRNR